MSEREKLEYAVLQMLLLPLPAGMLFELLLGIPGCCWA